MEDIADQLAVAEAEVRLFGGARRMVRVGRFEIARPLGAGGLGAVYAAWDPQLEREIALKVLRDDIAVPPEQLIQEARAMAKLSHPNIVAVYDVGEHAGRVFIAMERVDGTTLRGWLASERRSWRAIVARFREAGRGLAAAHTRGLVHRDFKPDNVLIGADGERTLVGDFGLAEIADREAGAGGTPKYMAPEQRERTRVTPASDQYAFCAALSEALSTVRTPRTIKRAIARGLSARPEDRHPSMDLLLDALAFDPARLAVITVVALVLSAALIGAILQMVMMFDYMTRAKR